MLLQHGLRGLVIEHRQGKFMIIPRYYLNAVARHANLENLVFPPEQCAKVLHYFRDYPGLRATPLHALRSQARKLGIGELLVKDESQRLNLNSFKILGVSYAVHRLLAGGDISQESLLTCATDGNHGLAVAHVARESRLRARIYVPKGMRQARRDAIAAEGAEVVVVEGNYDDAVTQAAADAAKSGWVLVSDTSWPGYEVIPKYIMARYTMLMAEAAEQWLEPPDVVFVQAGVGGLACAVVSWFYGRLGSKRPFIVSCEPTNAACVLESMQAGERVVVKGSLETIMAGLSCGTVSSAAWPVLRFGLDASVAITDDECAEAVRMLGAPRSDDPIVVAGESGACGVAALESVLCRDELCSVREYLNLGPQSRVLAINTEGATDPEG